jgi:hypothetical protein
MTILAPFLFFIKVVFHSEGVYRMIISIVALSRSF